MHRGAMGFALLCEYRCDIHVAARVRLTEELCETIHPLRNPVSCFILERSEESRILDARPRASILTSPVISREVPLAHGGLVAERRGGEGSADPSEHRKFLLSFYFCVSFVSS